MELSDLTYYNNQLFSFDDRTGIVYEIDPEKSLVRLGDDGEGEGRREQQWGRGGRKDGVTLSNKLCRQ